MISEVSLFGVPPERAALLLQKFQWDLSAVEKLIGDKGTVTPVTVVGGISLAACSMVEKPTTPDFECSICWDSVEDTVACAMSVCQHFFHKKCFRNYLREELKAKGQIALLAGCPTNGCTYTCDIACFHHLFQGAREDHSMMEKYMYFRISNFVESHPHYRWCPHCRRPVYYEHTKSSSNGAVARSATPPPNSEKSNVVQCTQCDEEFCFSCGNEAHAPCSCHQLREWLKKECDDSETANYLAAFTKPCPKCGNGIEKNGGCNKMICSRCSGIFCWVCETKWNGSAEEFYAQHKCNLWAGDDEIKALHATKDSQHARDQARNEFERYTFYYKRYKAHEQSKKLEAKLVERLKSAENYVTSAALVLVQCRHAMKYTCAYVYYLPKTIGKELFEHRRALFLAQFQQLQRQTERLSGYLEAIDKNRSQVDRLTIVAAAEVAQHTLNNLRGGQYEQHV